MTEKEIIKKIQKLRQIKPRKEWVVLTKSQILGEPYREGFSFRFFLNWKPVLVTVTAFGIILFGLFISAQKALPGDFLYPLKKITEKSRAVFVSEEKKPKLNLELVDKRLEELTQVVESNQVKKLVPALNEFKKTKTTAKKEIVKNIKNKPKEEATKLAKELAPKLKEINEKEKRVYAILDTEPTEEINQTAEKTIVEILINDAKNSTLTEEQKTDLLKIEEYYNKGEYQKALELFLTSSLNFSY